VIPIATELQPRSPDDPVVTVVGIEGSRYNLAPVNFGAVFQLGYDEITAAYVCDGHQVFVQPYDEAAEWRKLSREPFVQLMSDGPRKARKQRAEDSPEQVFRAAEASDATKDANRAFGRKLSRKA
jgi:hypothetical protein